MAILVTGGAGYIGSHMALRLLDEGEKVVVCDDLSRGDERLVPPEAEFIRQDVGDADAMARILEEHDVEAVIHFAGFVVVPESVRNPTLYYRKNTVVSLGLAEACIAAGVDKFIFSSTAAVYGEATGSGLIKEQAETSPISPYGASKLMTEQILADMATASGLRSICLRYFNVAGADPLLRSGQISPEATHLIKVISQVVVGQRPQLTIFGNDYPTADGTCERDYIHVSDLVDAHYLALAHLRAGRGSRIFNCGYGRGTSVSQVVSACEKVAGRVVPVKLGPRREGDPAVLVADSSSIRQELGWTPRHDKLETIIRTALDWEARVASLAPRT